MSVAFRRDGDEEHLEPSFEIPIPPGPNWVTARGMAQTRARLEALDAALPGVTDEAERKAALRVLRYWHTRVATAEIPPLADGTTVEFGCRVTYRLRGKTATIAIVGDDEAAPAAGAIAFSAPLARAMMGAEVGECVDFNGAADAIEIIAITPLG